MISRWLRMCEQPITILHRACLSVYRNAVLYICGKYVHRLNSDSLQTSIVSESNASVDLTRNWQRNAGGCLPSDLGFKSCLYKTKLSTASCLVHIVTAISNWFLLRMIDLKLTKSITPCYCLTFHAKRGQVSELLRQSLVECIIYVWFRGFPTWITFSQK